MADEEVRAALAHVREHTGSLPYAQFQDWIQVMYDESKDKVIRCMPEEREKCVGMALAYKMMLECLET